MIFGLERSPGETGNFVPGSGAGFSAVSADLTILSSQDSNFRNLSFWTDFGRIFDGMCGLGLFGGLCHHPKA